jgi:hypothetical protein
VIGIISNNDTLVVVVGEVTVIVACVWQYLFKQGL